MQFLQPTLAHEFLSAFVEIWRLWVPLLILLILVGWVTRRSWGGRLLLFSLVLIACFVAKVAIRERAIEHATTESWNRLRKPLTQDTKIDGFQLAAGTVVRWNKDEPEHLLTAELGAGQEVSPGIVLIGEVDHLWGEVWRGTLAKDSVLRGWPCAAGKVDIHNTGELRWCLLARPLNTAAGVVPKDTAVLLEPGDPSDALLHLPNVGMRANPGGFWIVPDEWFVLYSNGELLAVPGPVTRRGVTFHSTVVLRYGDEDVTRWYGYSDTAPPPLARPPGQVTGWRGDLSSPLVCEGNRRIEKGNRVTIPIHGDVVTTTHWDSSRPRAKPVIDSFHCNLNPID